MRAVVLVAVLQVVDAGVVDAPSLVPDATTDVPADDRGCLVGGAADAAGLAVLWLVRRRERGGSAPSP